MGREEPPEVPGARLSHLPSLVRGDPGVVALSPIAHGQHRSARSKPSRRNLWAGSPLSLYLLFPEPNGQASGMWRGPQELVVPSLQLVSSGTGTTLGGRAFVLRSSWEIFRFLQLCVFPLNPVLGKTCLTSGLTSSHLEVLTAGLYRVSFLKIRFIQLALKP